MAFSFQPKLASLDGLVLYLDAGNTKSYPGSGTTWTDLSQTAITGSLTNGPTFSSTVNGTIRFDGTNDYVEISNNTNLNPVKEFTLGCWVNVSSLPTIYLGIIDKYNGSFNYGYVIDTPNGGGGRPLSKFRFVNCANNTYQEVIATGSFVTGSWYNVVGTYDGTNINIYVNGIFDGKAPLTGNNVIDTGSLKLGGDGVSTNYLSCSISQVTLYNRPLSATEVLQNYNAICGRFGKTTTITDSDALSFVNAANISNETQQSAINTLVTDLKGAGLWSKMKAIYPFVGGTAASHKFNLKDPRDVDAAFRLTFSGGWTHSSTGITGNGTNAYADTYLIPTTNLIENNTHHSNYSRTDGVGGVEIGGMSSTGYFWHLNRYSEPGYENICLSYMYRTAQIEASNTNGTGYYIASRTASNTFKVFKNSNQLGINTSTTSGWSTTNVKLYIGARNNQGTADGYSNRNLAFATIGDGLTDTDAANLYTIVQKYQTTLGRQV